RQATSQYDFLYNIGRGQVELYDPNKHDKWEIQRGSDGKLRGCTVGESGDVTNTHDNESRTKEKHDYDESRGTSESLTFPLENHLRDFIAMNIGSISVDGKVLRFFVDNDDTVGMEYQTDIGRIDLLAVEEDDSY